MYSWFAVNRLSLNLDKAVFIIYWQLLFPKNPNNNQRENTK